MRAREAHEAELRRDVRERPRAVHVHVPGIRGIWHNVGLQQLRSAVPNGDADRSPEHLASAVKFAHAVADDAAQLAPNKFPNEGGPDALSIQGTITLANNKAYACADAFPDSFTSSVDALSNRLKIPD